MIEITVKDMTCGHCAASITEAVRRADAGAGCEIDLAARKVRIAGARAAEPFVKAIADAGFAPVLRDSQA